MLSSGTEIVERMLLQREQLNWGGGERFDEVVGAATTRHREECDLLHALKSDVRLEICKSSGPLFPAETGASVVADKAHSHSLHCVPELAPATSSQ